MTIFERGSLDALYSCYNKEHPFYAVHDCMKDFAVPKGSKYKPDILRYNCFGFRKAIKQELLTVFKPPKEKSLYKQEEKRRFDIAVKIASSASADISPLVWDLVYNWPLQQIEKEHKRLLFDKKSDSNTLNIEKAKDVPIEELYDGELRPSGNRLSGLCQFHNERTPSFIIYQNNNRWHCFGACGEGGDSIAYWMKLKNIPFIQAVKELNTYEVSK